MKRPVRLFLLLWAWLCLLHPTTSLTAEEAPVAKLAPSVRGLLGWGTPVALRGMGVELDVGRVSGVPSFRAAFTQLNGRQTNALKKEHIVSLAGMLVEARGYTPLREGFHLLLAGSAFLPISTPPLHETGDGHDKVTPDWETACRWFTVEADLVRPICGPCSLMAGFRYDFFSSQFAYEPPQNPFESRLQETEVTAKGFVPFFGLTLGTADLQVRLRGFPWVGGGVNYRERISGFIPQDRDYSGDYSEALFLEMDCRYLFGLGGAKVGLFLKWQYIRATARLTGGHRPHDMHDVDLRFRRPTWLLGGTLAMSFDTPS